MEERLPAFSLSLSPLLLAYGRPVVVRGIIGLKSLRILSLEQLEEAALTFCRVVIRWSLLGGDRVVAEEVFVPGVVVVCGAG